MKYVLTWRERPGGSYADYEGAQKRVLTVFQKWEMPKALNFQQFLVRIGEFGGYAVIDTDDPSQIHRMTTVFAAFEFRLEPVLEIADAVAAESAAIHWRDSLRM